MLSQLDYKIFGLKTIKELYEHDADFKEIMLHCKEGKGITSTEYRYNHTTYSYSTIHSTT